MVFIFLHRCSRYGVTCAHFYGLSKKTRQYHILAQVGHLSAPFAYLIIKFNKCVGVGELDMKV